MTVETPPLYKLHISRGGRIERGERVPPI